jgi:uncharacterized protein (TIGR03435 family)
LLSLVLDRPVIDRTGITGKFEIHLAFSPDDLTAAPHEPASAPEILTAPPIFTGIQEQLGLRLVPANGPIDVLVIDHLERPSEN